MTAVAGSFTRAARLAPDLAAAAAALTGGTHRKLERDSSADVGLPFGESDLGAQTMGDGVGLDEGVPHPFDAFADGRKIKRHFVGKRPTKLSIGGGVSLDHDPRVIDPPVLLHDPCS